MLGNIVAGTFSAGVAPVPFTPTDISGLKLWLDAADTSTISVSGSQVTQWDDKSGNNYDFNQTTAGNRPLSGTRTINSKNVIDFDGSDDRLITMNAKSVWTFMHSSNVTFFWAGVIDGSQDRYIMADAIGSGAYRGYTVGTGTDNLIYNLISSGSTAGASGEVSNSRPTTTYNTSPTYFTIKTEPAASAANRAFTAMKNGSFEGNNTRTATASTGDSIEVMALGSVQFAGTFQPSFNGAMGEILIYDSILSAGDITKVQDYLAAKWAI